jgi:Domain of unknown function (DUF5606)
MTLKEIAAISGKPGLFRIVKPTRTGVIIESLDASKKRDIASAQAKVSLLNEITVYTTTAEGSVPLRDLLKKAFELFPDGNGLTGKSEGADLQDFMAQIAPDFDRERVYNSDIKKIAVWYNTLLQVAPEVFMPEDEVAQNNNEEAETTKEESHQEAEPLAIVREEVSTDEEVTEVPAPVKPKAAPKAKKPKKDAE